MSVTGAPRKSPLLRWFGSTPHRTFIVYPIAVAIAELALHSGHVEISWWGLPLLIWGYLQYRLTGRYRRRLGGGGPGIDAPPVRLVTSGPYRFTRNPMYLGHLIFITGIAVTLRSWIALALLLFTAAWFHRRVLRDEKRMQALFGAPYADYTARVRRWIPAIA